MSGSIIKTGATVNYAIIDEDVLVDEGAVIGEDKSEAKGIAVLGRKIRIGKKAKVLAGSIIDKNIENGEEA